MWRRKGKGMQDRQIREVIRQARLEARLSGEVNVFLLKDGSVAVEPADSTWGYGVPADPGQYSEYWLGVPVGKLEEIDDVIDVLS